MNRVINSTDDQAAEFPINASNVHKREFYIEELSVGLNTSFHVKRQFSKQQMKSLMWAEEGNGLVMVLKHKTAIRISVECLQQPSTCRR